MLCTKFQVFRSKTVTGGFGQTDIHTEDRNRGNPVETEIPHWARYWLVNSTGLKTVMVSEYNRFV